MNSELSFIWFLVALFHDLGYYYEDENSTSAEDPEFDFGVGHLPVPQFIPCVYKRYLTYRKHKDHGIRGGCQLFESLEKNHLAGMKNVFTLCNWGSYNQKSYRYVSCVVITHNIWFARERESCSKILQDYQKYGLSELVLSSDIDEKGIYKEYPYSFEKYPLLFFFCLIDSIDPPKCKPQTSAPMISFDNDSKVLTIKTENSKYAETIKGLNSWLCPVSCTKDDKSRCTLRIHFEKPSALSTDTVQESFKCHCR